MHLVSDILEPVEAGEEFYNALKQVPSTHALHYYDTAANNFHLYMEYIQKLNPGIFMKRDAERFSHLKDFLDQVKDHKNILEIGLNTSIVNLSNSGIRK